MIKCPTCHVNEAKIDPVYGVTACNNCRVKKTDFSQMDIEFTTDEIKEERKKYSEDFLPPHRKGYLDKRWVQKYGQEAARNRGFSQSEIDNAKDAWTADMGFYKE